jgi:hypothetical protein
MRRINFTVAAFSRPFSRIDCRYSNSGRTLPGSASGSVPGTGPVLRLQPPQAAKQAAEHTAPPPALHFRISPAYRNIYPPTQSTVGNSAYYARPGPLLPIMPSVLRWRHGGGIHCPSPSPPGFPLSKTTRRGLFSPLRSATFRPQPRPSTAQRGRGSPRPVAGGRKVKKTQRSVFVFFSFLGGVLPPPPPHRHSGA